MTPRDVDSSDLVEKVALTSVNLTHCKIHCFWNIFWDNQGLWACFEPKCGILVWFQRLERWGFTLSFHMVFSLVLSGAIRTFIIKMIVLSAIIVIMKYSNGVETTIRQILYFTESLFFGMYRHRGLALIAKSMHCFWKRKMEEEMLEDTKGQVQNLMPGTQCLFWRGFEKPDFCLDPDPWARFRPAPGRWW